MAVLSNAVVPMARDVRPVTVVRSDGWAESDNLLISIVAANDDGTSPLAPWSADNRDDIDVFILLKSPVAG